MGEQLGRARKVGRHQPIKDATQLVLIQPGSILRKLSRVSFRPIPRASLLQAHSADHSASDFKKHPSYSTMADAESQQPPAAAQPAQEAPAAEEKPPKFSPSEFRIYNRMAEHMDYYV